MVGLEWYPCCKLQPVTRTPLFKKNAGVRVYLKNVNGTSCFIFSNSFVTSVESRVSESVVQQTANK